MSVNYYFYYCSGKAEVPCMKGKWLSLDVTKIIEVEIRASFGKSLFWQNCVICKPASVMVEYMHFRQVSFPIWIFIIDLVHLLLWDKWKFGVPDFVSKNSTHIRDTIRCTPAPILADFFCLLKETHSHHPHGYTHTHTHTHTDRHTHSLG